MRYDVMDAIAPLPQKNSNVSVSEINEFARKMNVSVTESTLQKLNHSGNVKIYPLNIVYCIDKQHISHMSLRQPSLLSLFVLSSAFLACFSSLTATRSTCSNTDV